MQITIAVGATIGRPRVFGKNIRQNSTKIIFFFADDQWSPVQFGEVSYRIFQ